MKLSVYTFVKDGLFYDFHVAAMLRHHLPLADEIVVNEGYSTDGTFEAIRNIDPKIQVHRFHWDQSNPSGWHREFKNQARRLCTGDWCILLDCDEFIPEWEFPKIREALAATEKTIHPLKYVHFYGNYKIVNTRPQAFHWPVIKHAVHRNLEDLEVWGDGSNVGQRGQVDMTAPSVGTEPLADVHHFGFVRNAARLRQKWRVQAKQHDPKNPRWDRVPGKVFDMFPHRWDDPDFLNDLAIYDGPHIQAVRDDPAEFVRDDLWLYNYVSGRAGR
jgi:glycosyltransferase involved in cell wall biosynthesis